MPEEEIIVAAPAPKADVPMLPILLAVVVAAILTAVVSGGVLFWAVKSGRLPLGGVKTVEVLVKADPVKTKLVPLDPLLVNLSDADGRSYLRVALTLKVVDVPDKEAKPKEEKAEKGAPKNEFEAAERDAALGILGKETGAELLAPDGKDRLKRDLKAALAEHVPEVKIDDVLITEFLVQR